MPVSLRTKFVQIGKVQNRTREWTQVVREFPQSPQGRLRQQRPRSAGSSASSTRMFRRVVCVTNAPVPQGRLRDQRIVAQKPWGGPSSCDPAPLTTSLRGLWVSGNAGTGQWWNERRGGDPRTDRATQRGGDPKTDHRNEELSKQLGCEGEGPENPGKHENLQKEVHTAGGPGRYTNTGRWHRRGEGAGPVRVPRGLPLRVFPEVRLVPPQVVLWALAFGGFSEMAGVGSKPCHLSFRRFVRQPH